MPNVVGIRFKNCGKIYDFEINGLEVHRGDQVIIESEFGLSIGNVAMDTRVVEKPAKELKRVLRLANKEDLQQKQDNEKFEKDAKTFCYERIAARGLPMKLVCSEVALDRRRIVFYFTADGRIDFRELVKDLAAKFKTRIEMRQIGVRDKAKLVGGLGTCGKELCCRLFLTSFEPISIKMAKQQDLTLNTGKLSGTCGRLMCCLGYEYNENDSSPGSRRRAEKVAVAPEDQPLAEAAEELMDVLSPDIGCCTADRKMEHLPAATGKTEEEKPEGAAPKKRRRRRPRRRGPKKSE